MSANLDFVTVDVETANHDLASICQVGICRVQVGQIVDSWGSYCVPPVEPWFHPMHTRIHGIDERVIADAPEFAEISGAIRDRLTGLVVSHTLFDRRSILKAGVDIASAAWLDSTRIVRRAWPERYAKGGYGLANVARDLQIEFKHHDAIEDAATVAKIILLAWAETGFDIKELTTRVRSRRDPIRFESTGDGTLSGHTVVFTGALNIVRREAAQLAANAGADVEPNVTARTTLLVVGERDVLPGYPVSNKHAKAMGLIETGQGIWIIDEVDFMELIGGEC